MGLQSGDVLHFGEVASGGGGSETVVLRRIAAAHQGPVFVLKSCPLGLVSGGKDGTLKVCAVGGRVGGWGGGGWGGVGVGGLNPKAG